MTSAAQTVQDILDGIEDTGETLTPGRYPSTYGRDFFRSHSEAFGEPSGDWTGNRGEAGTRIRAYCARTGQNYADVLIALADGYLAEWRVRATPEEKADALAAYIEQSWLGFFDAQPTQEQARQRARDLVFVAALAAGRGATV